MPSRGKVEVKTGTPAETQPKVVQSSPLKLAAHKFLKAAGVYSLMTEETERMVKVEEQKVPSLYVTFQTDEAAHKAAMFFLQEGDEFGGTADELFCCGFPKTDPTDDLILMFQFIPRESLEVALSLNSPDKATKALIAECGKIPHTILPIPEKTGEPKGLIAEFETEEDAARVAWQYISTDTNDGEKANPLYCIGEKGENLTLAFYSVAGA